MFCSLCCCILEFLPYIILVTLPMCGSFFGTDIILRFSLLLIINEIVCEVCAKTVDHFRISLSPFLKILALFVLACLPIGIVPSPVTWLYDKVLWISEPALLFAEVMLAVNFFLRRGQDLAEKVEEEDNMCYESLFNSWRVVSSLFTSLCYCGTVYMCYDMFYNQPMPTVMMWILTCVIVLGLSVHNMMWMSKNSGILADAAFVTFCCVSIVYIMVLETEQQKNSSKPADWNSYSDWESSYDVLWNMLHVNADRAHMAIRLLVRFLNPFFLVILIVRLYCILFIVEKIKVIYLHEEDEIEILDKSQLDEFEVTPWKSPLSLKISVIFIFTQICVEYLYEFSGSSTGFLTLLPYISEVWPSYLSISRILQILLVNGFYIWRLYCAEDWEWHEWFS